VLPLIVIGADERTGSALRQCGAEPDCRFYDNTEDAAYALNDDLRQAVAASVHYGAPGVVEFDGHRNAWRVNVAYGPKVLGLAATGQPVRLPHTGWTLVLAWNLPDIRTSRRVVGGVLSGPDEPTIPTQAATMLGANVIVDLSAPATDATPFPGLVAMFAQMRERSEP
jgi:hypothetical protein